MIVERFRPEHVLELPGAEADLERAERFAEVSPAAYTVRVDGVPILCGGVADLAPGKALLWSFVSPRARKYPVLVHRSALRFLGTLRYRRIEATCEHGVALACDWLKRLGFEYEGTMRSWTVDGRDFDLYSKVRL